MSEYRCLIRFKSERNLTRGKEFTDGLSMIESTMKNVSGGYINNSGGSPKAGYFIWLYAPEMAYLLLKNAPQVFSETLLPLKAREVWGITDITLEVAEDVQ